MGIKICHASIDENGKAKGGAAGDQTGREVCIRDWYSKPWQLMLRYPDSALAKKAAEIAEKLCKSNLVGYDQGGRNTLYQMLRKYRWDVDAYIASGEKSETDCSAFVYAVFCCLIESMRSDSNAPTTSTMQNRFTAWGFKCYTESKYLTSDEYLMPGDLLVKPGSHTAMADGTGSKVTTKVSNTTASKRASTLAEDGIWSFLVSHIGNKYGAAGMMGNIYAESGLSPKNLQNSYESKLGYTDDSYVKAVDDGSYTNFAKDSAGFGYCQWTYWTRKRDLKEYTDSKGVSIADATAQLEFLMKELQGGYKSVLNTLKNATSVKEASDAVVTGFEKPADQSEAALAKRASYGQKFYDAHAETGTQSTAPSGFTPYKVKCTASSLNVRSGPGTNYGVLGVVNKGHSFTIRAESGSWGKVCLHPDNAPKATITGWLSLNYTVKV